MSFEAEIDMLWYVMILDNLKQYDCDIINNNLIEPEVLTNTVYLSQQTLEL